MAAIILRIFPDFQLYSREPHYIFTRNPLFIREDSMKKLFALPVMSGASPPRYFILTSLSDTGGSQATQAITLKPGSVIQEGWLVSIEYTFGDKTGKVIDSSVGKEPVPGLEKELTGLKDRRSKKIVVKPEDGYRADPNAFQEIPKTSSRLRCKR
jgi:hypothetical protein